MCLSFIHTCFSFLLVVVGVTLIPPCFIPSICDIKKSSKPQMNVQMVSLVATLITCVFADAFERIHNYAAHHRRMDDDVT